MKLTQKQETFVVSYFQTGNATQSAITAGYSPKTASVIAVENLRKPNISARLQELNDTRDNPRIASVNKRKERLTDFILEDNAGQYGYARAPNIQAVDVLNKMEKIYTEEYAPVEIVQSFVFVLPDGTKVTPKQLIEHKEVPNV